MQFKGLSSLRLKWQFVKATTVVKFDKPLFSERVDEDLLVALFDFFHDVLKYDEDIWLNWGLF